MHFKSCRTLGGGHSPEKIETHADVTLDKVDAVRDQRESPNRIGTNSRRGQRKVLGPREQGQVQLADVETADREDHDGCEIGSVSGGVRATGRAMCPMGYGYCRYCRKGLSKAEKTQDNKDHYYNADDIEQIHDFS